MMPSSAAVAVDAARSASKRALRTVRRMPLLYRKRRSLGVSIS
jgi:hypothetical protein